MLSRSGNGYHIIIDNQLLNERRNSGLFLNLDRLVKRGNEGPLTSHTLSTARAYVAADSLRALLPDECWKEHSETAIGERLTPEMFHFKRDIESDIEGQDHLEMNLLNAMPWIVTSPSPLLVAAQVSAQAEFDRAFRSIVREKSYHDKRMLLISCLNIDISPRKGQVSPLTKCIPWAAYIQDGKGGHQTLEQAELTERLLEQSAVNPDQIDLEEAIRQMEGEKEIRINA